MRRPLFFFLSLILASSVAHAQDPASGIPLTDGHYRFGGVHGEVMQSGDQIQVFGRTWTWDGARDCYESGGQSLYIYPPAWEGDPSYVRHVPGSPPGTGSVVPMGPEPLSGGNPVPLPHGDYELQDEGGQVNPAAAFRQGQDECLWIDGDRYVWDPQERRYELGAAWVQVYELPGGPVNYHWENPPQGQQGEGTVSQAP